MKNLTFSIPLGFDDKQTLMLHIQEPSFDRVRACLPLFRYVFQNQSLFSNVLIACKDFDELTKDILEDKGVALNFSALMEEAIQNTKVVCIVEEGKAKDCDDDFSKFYNKFDDDERAFFKTLLVFIFALLHYLPAKLLKKELSEFYTRLNFMDYKNSFLNSIEEASTK